MDNNTDITKCNKKTEVYSRVVGFYRPVEQYNDGKKEEFFEKKVYTIGDKKNSLSFYR